MKITRIDFEGRHEINGHAGHWYATAQRRDGMHNGTDFILVTIFFPNHARRPRTFCKCRLRRRYFLDGRLPAGAARWVRWIQQRETCLLHRTFENQQLLTSKENNHGNQTSPKRNDGLVQTRPCRHRQPYRLAGVRIGKIRHTRRSDLVHGRFPRSRKEKICWRRWFFFRASKNPKYSAASMNCIPNPIHERNFL